MHVLNNSHALLKKRLVLLVFSAEDPGTYLSNGVLVVGATVCILFKATVLDSAER